MDFCHAFSKHRARPSLWQTEGNVYEIFKWSVKVTGGILNVRRARGKTRRLFFFVADDVGKPPPNLLPLSPLTFSTFFKAKTSFAFAAFPF
jgi:hypothetical protein